MTAKEQNSGHFPPVQLAKLPRVSERARESAWRLVYKTLWAFDITQEIVHSYGVCTINLDETIFDNEKMSNWHRSKSSLKFVNSVDNEDLRLSEWATSVLNFMYWLCIVLEKKSAKWFRGYFLSRPVYVAVQV